MLQFFLKDWIVYVMITGFIWFVTYLAITSRKQKKMKQEQKEAQEKR